MPRPNEEGGAVGIHPAPARLQAHLDREASPAESLGLARHLHDCAPCRGLLARMASLARAITDLPAAEVPEEFTGRVMARVRAMPRPRPLAARLRLLTPLLAFLAAGLTLLAGPWTVGMARGAARSIPWHLIGPAQALDLLLALAGAALASLGRAAESLGPWTSVSGPAPVPQFHPQVALTLLSMALLGATLLGIAVASGGLFRLRSPKAEAARPSTD